MKIILVGHGCHPELGSEPGLTWNWASQLSLRHQVWVLTHPWSRKIIERHLAANPNPNLRFIWITIPKSIDPWNPARGERGLRLHYLGWQRQALHAAIKLNKAEHCDLVHHVCWGTLSAPPLLWKLPIPFIWGPVGGGQTAPSAFREYFGASWPKELLRKVRLALSSGLPSLSRAARRSAIVFSTNGETTERLRRAGADNVVPFLDNGLAASFLTSSDGNRENRSQFTLLWAGRLERRKALPLALEALAQIEADINVRLLVAGEGPQRAEWEGLASRLQIAHRVEFVGMLPRSEMPKLFRQADAFIFTSLRDAFGSVVLEAAGYGLPIITLDHQGVGQFVPPAAAIKAPVTTPSETILALASGIRILAGSPDLRRRMSAAACAFAETQHWHRRAEEMEGWYQKVVRRKPSLDHAVGPVAPPASGPVHGAQRRQQITTENLRPSD